MTPFISLPASAVNAALAKKPKGPLRFRRGRGARAAIIPTEMEYAMTADHLVESPREPSIIPIGVLDENGHMICRVHIPIKQQLGFFTGGNAWTGDCEEEVVLLQTENLIRMSNCGVGIESVDPSELGDDDDDEE